MMMMMMMLDAGAFELARIHPDPCARVGDLRGNQRLPLRQASGNFPLAVQVQVEIVSKGQT